MFLQEIKEELNHLAEEKFRDFSFALVKESALPMLGVRTPALRKMAARIAKEDARGFLDACDFSSIEMATLYGFVLGKLRGDIGEALAYFDRAVEHVDNWLNCDGLCGAFKQAAKHRAEVWDFLQSYRASKEPFRLRVLVVMLMSHFLTDEYIDRVLKIVDEIRCDAYYYRMGAAWCVATAMAKYREKTFAYLKTCHLDDWTYHKAIRKMLESYRVSDGDKALLRQMDKERAQCRS